MPYKVGISSGWWNIAKDPSLLGLTAKAGSFGATTGVQFNQVDLETITEFIEPDMKNRFKRTVKELGLEIGLHAEVGDIMALESAERRIWEQAHRRLVITMKHAAELEMIYVNIHLSQNVQLQQREQQIRPFGYQYQVVGPDGKPLHVLCDKSSAAKKAALSYIDIRRGVSADKTVLDSTFNRLYKEELEKFEKEIHQALDERRRQLDDFVKQGRMTPEHAQVELKNYENELRSRAAEAAQTRAQRRLDEPDIAYSMWKNSPFGQYFIDSGEIGANLIVAEHMKATGDPLWTSIVNSVSVDKAYNQMPEEFNAALSAKYLEGHFYRRDHSDNKKYLNGMNVIEWCEKKKIRLLLEMPHSQAGTEGLLRFYNPIHSQHLVKKINSPMVMLCIDFEQTMAQNIDIDDMLKKVDSDFGSIVFLLHLGEPIPYFGTAHIPMAIGSHSQEILYRWIYGLRQKGFNNGYIIFERGSGKTGGRTMYDVFENSIWVIRQIVKYLDKDIPPKELPPEFFGISFENKDVYARQLASIRAHAWDPLADVMQIPEEKHTFLSGEAVRKGKGAEWERRKYR